MQCLRSSSLNLASRDGFTPLLHSPAQQPVLATPQPAQRAGLQPHHHSKLPIPRGALTATRVVAQPQQSGTSSSKPTKDTTISPTARMSLFSTKDEKMDEQAQEVTGTIPTWLKGSLVANGGGDYEGQIHLFDGLAMLTKLRISDGKVWASQKYLDSEQFRSVRETGKRKWREFATPVPDQGLLERAAGVMGLITRTGFTDNGSVNAIALPSGQVLASSETISSMYLVDPSTLKTLGKVQLGDPIPGDLTTAHPKLLRDGCTLVNFSRSIPAGGFHVYKQDGKTLEREQIGFIRDMDPTAPAWVHDICYTGNHIVICETPLFFNLPAMVSNETRDYQFMDWKPERGTYVHVVPLDGQAHKTYKTSPFFAFHYANGFEENGCLYVDMGYYDDPQGINDLELAAMKDYPGGEYALSYLSRLAIPLSAPSGAPIAPPRPLSDQPQQYGSLCDFPVINPNFRGMKHRYVYALAGKRPTNFGNALAKHDTATGEARLWHEAGGTTGECTFVPRPGGVDEDDGVVLCSHMGADGRSSLVVIDAKSWQELGRARLSYGLPYRFHGSFLPEVPQL